MRETTTIHGLRFFSTVVLPGPRDSLEDDPDVVIEVARGSLPRVEGRVYAHVNDPVSGKRYTLASADRGWAMTFEGAAVAFIDHAVRRAAVIAHPDFSDERLSVILGGPLLVALAMLRGHDVLHSSAISTQDGVIAFVGPSGCGKSTLAMLARSGDEPLYSDDALRLDSIDEGAGFLAHRGTTTSRLRSRADELAGGAVIRVSGDARRLVESTTKARDTDRLALIALPRLSTSFDRVHAAPAPKVAALVALSDAWALDGVIEPSWLCAHFDLASRLVESVHVVELCVPWGSGAIPADLGPQIRAELEDAAYGMA